MEDVAEQRADAAWEEMYLAGSSTMGQLSVAELPEVAVALLRFAQLVCALGAGFIVRGHSSPGPLGAEQADLNSGGWSKRYIGEM